MECVVEVQNSEVGSALPLPLASEILERLERAAQGHRRRAVDGGKLDLAVISPDRLDRACGRETQCGHAPAAPGGRLSPASLVNHSHRLLQIEGAAREGGGHLAHAVPEHQIGAEPAASE